MWEPGGELVTNTAQHLEPVQDRGGAEIHLHHALAAQVAGEQDGPDDGRLPDARFTAHDKQPLLGPASVREHAPQRAPPLADPIRTGA